MKPEFKIINISGYSAPALLMVHPTTVVEKRLHYKMVSTTHDGFVYIRSFSLPLFKSLNNDRKLHAMPQQTLPEPFARGNWHSDLETCFVFAMLIKMWKIR